MFNPNFTEAEAAPILHHQTDLSRQSLDAAIENYPASDTPFSAWLNTQRAILHANPQHIHDALFLGTLEEYATSLSRSGQHQAAMAWGRAAYCVGRRFAHGWFGFLDIAIAAGAIPTITVKPIKSGLMNNVGPSIPRRLMQFWDKPTPPPDVAILMDRMRLANSSWFYHRIDEQRATHYIDIHFGNRVLNAFNALRHVAARSDLFRACWLYQRGGVYIDADEDCVGTLEQLLHVGSQFVLSWTNGRPSCLNNWFAGTAPSNPIMKKIIALSVHQIEEAARRGIKLNAWILTGPGVYTMTCLDALASDSAGGDLGGLQLIEEPEYRRVINSAEFLAYRADPKSNWRLEKLHD
jgi:hypothetical protein